MRVEKGRTTRSENHQPFAKKSFGQNFLSDSNYIGKIITSLDPRNTEAIIEIGPGRGALTEKLLEKAGKVIAIELDKDLIPFLSEKFWGQENFHLIEADALKVDFNQLNKDQNPGEKFKLVANLPYYISTAILQKLIEERAEFSELILMFQREVVDRITAEPGNAERGFLTVLTEAYLQAEKLFDVPPNAFRPAPKVWSSVVRLTPKESHSNLLRDEKFFREIVSAGFRQKRKTIFNNLKNTSGELNSALQNEGGPASILEKSGIEPNRRAESLTLDEWIRLHDNLS